MARPCGCCSRSPTLRRRSRSAKPMAVARRVPHPAFPPEDVPRVFLLSPAHVGGLRAKLLLNPQAPFALAREFHQRGLTLEAVFTFTSGLYFRGKIAYATRFANQTRGDVVRVITSNAGLLDPATR